MLAATNPDGRSNAEVLRPWVNGLDLTRRSRGMWIIDFGAGMTESEAALNEGPFEYVRWIVKPEREKSRSIIAWWQHERPRTELRAALAGLTRYIATPNVTKHRLFIWLPAETLPDHALTVIARDDDYTFGVLHSRAHELWARAMGTQLREVESGFRYTPTTTFETFPFPEATDEQREGIADAARALVMRRNGVLGAPTDDEPNGRTLTGLYNQRPSWLTLAHTALDQAVLSAYGCPADMSDADLLGHLLGLNASRPAA
jgi:hypothetical protein